jgi:voltage-gated potassium channel
MFLMLVFELRAQEVTTRNDSWGDWLMTFSFLLEWLLGLILASKKKQYFFRPSNLFDFISCFPFGTLTKSIRITRFMRVFKVVRVVTRANRYKGPAEQFIRLIALVGATVFAGAYCIEIVEPSMLIPEGGGKPKFTTGLWWAWVTISTVGYGDVAPSTDAGRLVATPLIMIGVGVCGYISAYMMQIMSHHDDNEPLSRTDALRLEAKMDKLAQRLNIENWDKIMETEKGIDTASLDHSTQTTSNS